MGIALNSTIHYIRTITYSFYQDKLIARIPAKECVSMIISSLFKIRCNQAITWGGVLSLCLLSPFTLATIANDNFSQCKSSLAKRASSAGLSENITQQIIPSLQSITRVIALDKKQPEFTQTFANYMNTRVTNYHVRVGQEKLQTHKTLFNTLEKKYGIPRQYLVAFWGLETLYGKHKGKMDVLNALVTLACDKRRSEFFTRELLNLFTLIDTNRVTLDQLKGSWAGAMGHMQFMPSALLKYATDANNDGKVDVWQSEEDAITTAANYLHNIGWQTEERWGRQILLPKNFTFNSVTFDRSYPLSFFKKLGIKQVNLQALPDYEINAELYLPSGHQGPAFLLYPNFNVIMTWNLSRNYALSVGLLADKLVGQKGITLNKQTKHQHRHYSVFEMKSLQQQLNRLGYSSGEPDGIWGPKSRKAIREFQLQQGLIADGYPNAEVFMAMQTLQKMLE